MKCIIGLGNMGKEYENTRHNLGFMMIDYLSTKYNIALDKKRKKCIYGEGVIEGEKVSLVKPTTFMNLSGEAIVEIMNWYKIELKDILVVFDDIDLPLGTVRFKERGSAGTHNGVRNIVENLKSEEFARVKIGMENRNGLPIPLIDYVLQKFSTDELEKINKDIMPDAEQNVLKFLTNS